MNYVAEQHKVEVDVLVFRLGDTFPFLLYSLPTSLVAQEREINKRLANLGREDLIQWKHGYEPKREYDGQG